MSATSDTIIQFPYFQTTTYVHDSFGDSGRCSDFRDQAVGDPGVLLPRVVSLLLISVIARSLLLYAPSLHSSIYYRTLSKLYPSFNLSSRQFLFLATSNTSLRKRHIAINPTSQSTSSLLRSFSLLQPNNLNLTPDPDSSHEPRLKRNPSDTQSPALRPSNKHLPFLPSLCPSPPAVQPPPTTPAMA